MLDYFTPLFSANFARRSASPRFLYIDTSLILHYGHLLLHIHFLSFSLYLFIFDILFLLFLSGFSRSFSISFFIAIVSYSIGFSACHRKMFPWTYWYANYNFMDWYFITGLFIYLRIRSFSLISLIVSLYHITYFSDFSMMLQSREECLFPVLPRLYRAGFSPPLFSQAFHYVSCSIYWPHSRASLSI